MKVGMLLNVNNFTVDPATLARDAEELGFESLWTGDHPAIPIETTTPMPGTAEDIPEMYRHVSDPLVVLSLMAAATERLKLGTGIYILPCRNPVLTALQVATLDYFSSGRVLLGVGTGWLKEELDIFGADHANRMAQLKEYLAAVRALWSDRQASFDGRWVSFPPMDLNPRPFREGGPPVHLGSWGPKAVRRVAAWEVDGWLPMLVSPDDLRVEMDKLRLECEKRGRDPASIEVTLFEYDPGGDRAAGQEFLERYAEAGAHRVVLIQGLGDYMGSHEAALWTPEAYRGQLEAVAARYL
jgi:probable F420-dependent oxidoreductase